MKLYLRLSIVFLFVFGLHSCKTSKQTTSGSGKSIEVSKHEYFEAMLDNEIQYTSLSCKMNIELQSGNTKLGSKGSFKLIKDKAIQLSVSLPLLGTEMFRMHITPDSVIVLDRLNQRYIAEDISTFKARNAGLDFNALQCLFTNRLFIPGKSDVTKADYSYFNVNQKDNQMFLTLKGDKKLNYTFAGNSDSHIVSSYIGMQSTDYLMDWKYSEFENTGNSLFPSKMNVMVTGKGKNLNVYFTFSKIEKNTLTNVDFSIPGKYKRMDINDLLNFLVK